MKDVTGAGGSRLQRASNNVTVSLGKELGRGGEGAVFPVTGAPDLVAKIYLKPPAPAKADKLRSMARNASPALLRVAAWPVDVLTDPAGAVRGFLMPKVSAREDVHELYSPKSRRRAFPNVDFRFVVRAATNIARAFAQVQAVGHVIGDVNHGNALVGRDGTVVLIDCDSFQVRDGARMFTCDVGVPLFTPPELAGRGFRGLRRTANHDAFGLAVLLFHLLYLGRHPFAGKYADGEMPIERAIAESRFAYGANAARVGMSRPPGTLALDVYGADVAQLFERAFEPPGESPRPAPTQWVEVLQALESRLERCRASATHFFPRRPGGPDGGAPACCWCALERHTGLRLFETRRDTFDALGNAKLAPLWDAILAIPRPAPVKPLEVPPITVLEDEALDALGPLPRAVLSWLLIALSMTAMLWQPGEHFLLGLMAFGAALALRWKHRKLKFWRSERSQSLYRTMFVARKHLAKVIGEWNELASDQRFESLLEKLTDIKQQLLQLPKELNARLDAMQSEVARLQRYKFLDQITLAKAGLRNVTRQEISMLAAFDIDTAAEVLARSDKMQGLVGEIARHEILGWANACARNFVFDPKQGVDPVDARQVELLLLGQQEELLEELQAGQQELERIAQEISGTRSERERELAAARNAVDIARRREEA